MTYELVCPEVRRPFAEMSKRELADYFDWFMDVIPERVQQLSRLVMQSRGFEHWQPDLTRASLEDLGHWFAGQVQTRSRTEAEMDQIRGRLVFPIDIPSEELTGRTLSLAFDVGVYFSQVLAGTFPSLRWDRPKRSKKFVDYGQPVLAGFVTGVALNPIRIAVVLAYAIAGRNQSGGRLVELYDTWSKQAPTAPAH